MPHYLFTNDNRTSDFPDRLVRSAKNIRTEKVFDYSTSEGKSDGNVTNTNKFYFNLNPGSETLDMGENDPIECIRNFVLKFQYPNTREKNEYSLEVKDGIELAPFRVVVRILTQMGFFHNESVPRLSQDEILFYVFGNKEVYQNRACNYEEIISSIYDDREKGRKEYDLANIHWKQQERQLREMMKFLNLACKAFSYDNKILTFDKDQMSGDKKEAEFISKLLNYNQYWHCPNVPFNVANDSYAKYMDIGKDWRTDILVIKNNRDKVYSNEVLTNVLKNSFDPARRMVISNMFGLRYGKSLDGLTRSQLNDIVEGSGILDSSDIKVENIVDYILVGRNIYQAIKNGEMGLMFYDENDGSGLSNILFKPEDMNHSQISDYFSAIRTKPFMLLAGISGTGKSRIVRKLAQATVTEDLQRKYDKDFKSDNFKENRWKLHSPANFEIIQVKPNWHNSMDVVGYLSNLPSPHYVFTPFVEFIVRAWLNPEIPFFLCLDEMNLAPVEEYFAEYLSAIESRSFENGEYVTDPIIKPFSSFEEVEDERGNKINVCEQMLKALFPKFNANDIDSLQGKVANHFKKDGLTLPQNLVVIGTVNMDETTFSFSRKVLDRAMSIEMNEVDYDSFLKGATDDELKTFAAQFENADLDKLLVNREIDSQDVVGELGDDAKFIIDYLKQINALLDGSQFKLGYRAANEALLYVSAAKDFGEDDVHAALDNFTVMKVLSRIEGDSTKLKLDKETNAIQLENAEIDADEVEKEQGELNILTALRYIITQKLGEFYKADTFDGQEKSQDSSTVNVQEGSSNTDEDEVDNGTDSTETSSSEHKKEKVKLNSIKKIDSMIAQLRRDHFVSFWN